VEAENNMDVEDKDKVKDEDPEISDTETEFETEFKESPTANAMIVDVVFGHVRRRNMVDDGADRPSVTWDDWRKKPREERAKGRKPLGYIHGDIDYTYEEWVEAKRERRPVNMGYLFDFKR
jgi:hypothetical protein